MRLFIIAAICMGSATGINDWLAGNPETTAEPEVDCEQITISAEVDYCATKEYVTSNQQLEAALMAFERRTQTNYASDKDLGQELTTLVEQSHSAWLAFRDAQCKVEAFEIELTSPAYLTAYSACVIAMNTQRIKALNSF